MAGTPPWQSPGPPWAARVSPLRSPPPGRWRGGLPSPRPFATPPQHFRPYPAKGSPAPGPYQSMATPGKGKGGKAAGDGKGSGPSAGRPFWQDPALVRAAVEDPWGELAKRHPHIVVSKPTRQIRPPPSPQPLPELPAESSPGGTLGALQARIAELELALAAERRRSAALEAQLRALRQRTPPRLTVPFGVGIASVSPGPEAPQHPEAEAAAAMEDGSDVGPEEEDDGEKEIPEDEIPPYLRCTPARRPPPGANNDTDDDLDDDDEEVDEGGGPGDRLLGPTPRPTAAPLPTPSPQRSAGAAAPLGPLPPPRRLSLSLPPPKASPSP
eukprot:EG_transcript_17293